MPAVVEVLARRIGLDWRRHHSHEKQKETSCKQPHQHKKKQRKQKFTMPDGLELELYQKYSPRDVLGNGTYGVVFSSINLETNETVAIKKITDPFRCAATARRTLRETQILRRMGPHDNIVALKDVMLSSDNDDVYLVHELMDYNLVQVMAKAKPNLIPAGLVKYIMFQILTGVKFMHSANVIHRDLKPDNILVNNDWKVKICDFGLARSARPGLHKMTANVGTPKYMAPELLNKSEALYDDRVDIWSLGCILAELLGGAPGVAFYPSADPLAVNLLKRMLVVDPSQRVSASQALRHPYFSNLYDPLLDESAPAKVSLEVDRKPEGLDNKKIRDLLWMEMLFYHPEEHNFSFLLAHLFNKIA